MIAGFVLAMLLGSSVSNAILGYNNLIDRGVVSGGSYYANLPLTNLQDRRYGWVARSTSAATASTQFIVDLLEDESIRVLGLFNHSMTLDALIKVTASSYADFSSPSYSLAWTAVWPAVYDVDDMEWEDDNWWSAQATAEERASLASNWIKVLDATVSARYWKFEINDAVNTDGYVDIGRAFLGAGWQFGINMSVGAGIGVETKTGVQEALGGAEFFDRRRPFRVARFLTEWMDENEAMSKAFDIQRIHGIDKELVFVWDPADTLHALRRQFPCRLRQLSPIEYPLLNTFKTAWEAKELL